MFIIDYEFLNNKLIDLINSIRKTELYKNKDEIIEFLKDTKNLINQYQVNTDIDLFNEMDLSTSIKIVNNYLEKYLKKEKESLDKKIADGSITFSYDKTSSDSYCSYDDKNYDINISIEHKETDPGIIIHELMHSLNVNESNPNETIATYSEMISIFYELDIYRYMNENGYNIDINKIIKRKLMNLSNTIYLLEDTFKIIDIISTTGPINEETYYKLSKNNIQSKEEFDWFLFNYQEFIKYIDLNKTDLLKGYSYVIGTLLSIKYYKDNQINHKTFEFLNENINKMSPQNVKDFLGYSLNKTSLIHEANKKLQKKI